MVPGRRAGDRRFPAAALNAPRKPPVIDSPFFLADSKPLPQALPVPWVDRPCHRQHEAARVHRAPILRAKRAASILIHDSCFWGLQAVDRGVGRLQRHYGYTRRDGTRRGPRGGRRRPKTAERRTPSFSGCA